MTVDWERKLTVAGSAASILSLGGLFVDQRVMQTGVTDFLLKPAPVPVIALGIAPLLLIAAFLLGRRQRPRTTYTGLLHLQPQLITSTDRESPVAVPSDVLKSAEGGISTWVFLPQRGNGIRSTGHNRYLFAHATHSDPYKNVFALCRGPTRASALGESQWKLWLANSAGAKRTFSFADGADITPGWHHCLVRWQHASPKIEFLIDGVVVIEAVDYLDVWPQSLSGQIVIGAWVVREWSVNFSETHFWRTQLVSSFPGDEWVRQERQIAPPSGVFAGAELRT